jgi:hypothetical protein
LVNSRLDQFTAAPSGSIRMDFTLPGRPFSRSYGTILPSSLTRVSSLTSVCSTCPPVSVIGTGTRILPRGFSRRHGIRDWPAISQLASHLASKRRCGFPYSDWLRACPRTTIAWVPLPFPVPPSVITETTWYRNINLLAIGYAFRPRLRSRLTLSRRTLLRKPWTIGGGESHPTFVTHAGILTSNRSTVPFDPASRSWNALLPRAEPAGLHTHSFGG